MKHAKGKGVWTGTNSLTYTEESKNFLHQNTSWLCSPIASHLILTQKLPAIKKECADVITALFPNCVKKFCDGKLITKI
jgi:hypothetical protein